MDFINKYKKYKRKYLDLKYQLGGAVGDLEEAKSTSLNFDNSRMIENCNLCYNHAIIYLFYSIPEFKSAILSLQTINNTNKSVNSIPEQIDINLLLLYLKELFILMDKNNEYPPEIVNDIFILCNVENKFLNEYKQFIKNYYILAQNNLGYKFVNNRLYDRADIIQPNDEFDRLDNNEYGFLNLSLSNFMIVFSDILDKLFCYYIDTEDSKDEKVYIFEEHKAKEIKYNKYLIRSPFTKDSNPREYDFINIKEYKLKIEDNEYELAAILSGVYISPETAGDEYTEGPGGHYWLDIYNKSNNKFTMINDLEDKVEINYEREKNPHATAAISWLIYKKC